MANRATMHQLKHGNFVNSQPSTKEIKYVSENLQVKKAYLKYLYFTFYLRLKDITWLS